MLDVEPTKIESPFVLGLYRPGSNLLGPNALAISGPTTSKANRVNANSVRIPASYIEAVNSDECDSWAAAMANEYDSLMENGTWTLCQLPLDRKVIEGTWV